MYSHVREPLGAPSASFVRFQVTERAQRIALWAQHVFFLPVPLRQSPDALVGRDGRVTLSFVSVRNSSETLSIAFDPKSTEQVR